MGVEGRREGRKKCLSPAELVCISAKNDFISHRPIPLCGNMWEVCVGSECVCVCECKKREERERERGVKNLVRVSCLILNTEIANVILNPTQTLK